MVLPQMQGPQIGPKAAQHLQGTENLDSSLEKIQAKRHFQKGKERIIDSLPANA